MKPGFDFGKRMRRSVAHQRRASVRRAARARPEPQSGHSNRNRARRSRSGTAVDYRTRGYVCFQHGLNRPARLAMVRVAHRGAAAV